VAVGELMMLLFVLFVLCEFSRSAIRGVCRLPRDATVEL
jgi:hypothetical protein